MSQHVSVNSVFLPGKFARHCKGIEIRNLDRPAIQHRHVQRLWRRIDGRSFRRRGRVRRFVACVAAITGTEPKT